MVTVYKIGNASVGHAMATHMRAELVCDAVELAYRRGLVRPDANFHSDRGAQPGFNRSEWNIAPFGMRMLRAAISIALTTNSVRMWSATAHPTTAFE